MSWLFGNSYGDYCEPIFMTDDFRKWSTGRHPSSNAMAYFDMVRERDYATRLEF